MDESYEEDDYDDQEYGPDQYKYYFKFDPAAWDVWGKFLYDSLKDLTGQSSHMWYINTNIPGLPHNSIPVNSYFSNTGKHKNFQYLGNDYEGNPIWKKKYFVLDPIQIEWVNHLQQHAVHFLQQPQYYKNMFIIMN